MCGICGFLDLKIGERDKKNLLNKMSSLLKHRGPDDEGRHIDKRIGLGVRRLEIIDLKTGHQPIYNEKKNIVIILNGEIYNYIEQREDLEKKGHRFYTKSDTEVIIHLYEEYGLDFLKHLRGMFGLALWDKNNDRFILARDRFGIKPVYYWRDRKGIIFASEIKAILQYKKIPRKVNLVALDYYLAWQAIPAPHTMFEGIKKLPPANFLMIHKNQLTIRSFWELSDTKPLVYSNIDEAAEELKNKMKESIKLRLRSDVPVGVLLSGGVDSSLIASMAGELSSGSIKTFSVDLKEEGYSEKKYAQKVAKIINSEHFNLTVTSKMYWDFLEDMVWHLDEPMSDLATIPVYYISQLAKKHVKVLLSGEGSDEIFGGYYDRYNSGLKWLQGFHYLDKIISWQLRRKLWMKFRSKSKFNMRSNKYLDFLFFPLEYNFLDKLSTYAYTREMKEELYKEKVRLQNDEIINFQNYICQGNHNILNRLLFVDLKYNIPDYLLVKADRMSMAASMELRVPFLDHKVVEYAFKLPSDFKFNGKMTKGIIKKVAEEYLPGDIVHRSKMGFPIPMERWLRKEFKDKVSDILFDPGTVNRGYFNFNYIKRLWASHQKEELNHALPVWLIVLFELWHRRFID